MIPRTDSLMAKAAGIMGSRVTEGSDFWLSVTWDEWQNPKIPTCLGSESGETS